MPDFNITKLSGQANPLEVVNNLFKEEGIELKTDLNNKEIRAISLILFLSDYAEVPEFREFVKTVMMLKVSKDRKGRKEFIESYKRIKDSEDNKGKNLERMVTG